jgi:TrmH family RNA methyltransferase
MGMITSIQNPKVQLVRSLLARREQRVISQAYVIEGVRLAGEVYKAGISPELVLSTSQLNSRGLELLDQWLTRGVSHLQLSPELMNRISNTEQSQGILAVIPASPLPLPQQMDLIVIADGIQDPGNLGTILRSSMAAGVQAVFITSGTTDPYAPKVLRSGMGAHFHISVQQMSASEIITLITAKQPEMKVFLAEAGRGTPCWEANLTQPVALVLGSEAHGPGEELVRASHESISIPMASAAESLNVSVSAGILLFEVVRQRAMHGSSG